MSESLASPRGLASPKALPSAGGLPTGDPTALKRPEPAMAGYLKFYRSGALFKKWKRKYFALLGDTVCRFDNELDFLTKFENIEDQMLVGSCYADRFEMKRLEFSDLPNIPISCSFRLIFRERDGEVVEWKLFAEEEKECDLWMKSIKEVSAPVLRYPTFSVKEGNLLQLRHLGVGNWQTKYFVLTNLGKLIRYDSKWIKEPRKKIFQMRHSELILLGKEDCGYEFALKIKSKDKEEITVRAYSALERSSWIDAMVSHGAKISGSGLVSATESSDREDSYTEDSEFKFSGDDDLPSSRTALVGRLTPATSAEVRSQIDCLGELVHRGRLQVAGISAKKARWYACFLFKEFLVICKVTKKDFKVKEILDLKKAVISEFIVSAALPKGSSSSDSFSLTSQGRTVYLSMKEESFRSVWIRHLKTVILSQIPESEKKVPGYEHKYIQGTLFSCAVLNDKKALDYLISATAVLNFELLDSNGLAFSHLCAIHGSTDVAHILRKVGPKAMRCKDVNGAEAIHYAGRYHQPEMLEFFLRSDEEEKMSGDIKEMANLKDSEGHSLLWYTAFGIHLNEEKRVFSAIDCIETLRECGADFNHEDPVEHKTAIQHAASINNIVMVKVLLDNGADPFLRTNGRNTLHYALSTAAKDVIALFIQMGFQINERDDKGFNWINLVPPADVAGKDHIGLIIENGGRLGYDPGEKEKSLKFLGIDQSIAQPHIDQWKSVKEAYGEGRKKNYKFIEDKESSKCLACGILFTMVRRKHHCRYCGLLVCRYCSKKRYYPFGSTTLLRCCDACFNLMRYTKQSSKLVKTTDILDVLVARAKEEPDDDDEDAGKDEPIDEKSEVQKAELRRRTSSISRGSTTDKPSALGRSSSFTAQTQHEKQRTLKKKKKKHIDI